MRIVLACALALLCALVALPLGALAPSPTTTPVEEHENELGAHRVASAAPRVDRRPARGVVRVGARPRRAPTAARPLPHPVRRDTPRTPLRC